MRKVSLKIASTESLTSLSIDESYVLQPASMYLRVVFIRSSHWTACGRSLSSKMDVYLLPQWPNSPTDRLNSRPERIPKMFARASPAFQLANASD